MAIVIQTLSDSAQARKDLTSLRASVDNIQKSSEGLANKFTSIGKSLVFGAAATSATLAFTRLSDSMTNLRNGINALVDDSKQAERAIASIKNIAISTRTPLDATAKLFTKLTLASKDLGATQSQIYKVTQTITQGFKVSGASATETEGAIRQLAQAFASGKLAGDEFNSVMENAPVLARAIADGMGVSFGELFKLRDEGKLMAKDVFKAIISQSSQIEKKFKKVAVTYADAFTNIGNSTILLFDALSNAFLGSGGGFAETLNNWATGVANFANNFSFYLLKAKTIAIVFIIDVTNFFYNLWDDIVKDGPDAVFKLFRDLATSAYQLAQDMIPYGKLMYDNIMSYSAAVYSGSSAMFFAFLNWLNKSQQTQAISGWLAKVNESILMQANRLRDVLGRIDLSSIYSKMVSGLRSVWNALLSFDFTKLGQRLSAGIANAFQSLKIIDVNRFIPDLDIALATIKKWAEKAAHYFWWLYDVVIGHSYIPDLVEGVNSWVSKLSGGPLKHVKSFVVAAAALFAGLNPFKLLGIQLGGFTKLMLAGASAIGLAYGFRDKLGLTSTFDAVGDRLEAAADKLSTAGQKTTSTIETNAPGTYRSGWTRFLPKAMGEAISKGFEWYNAPVKEMRQDPVFGGVQKLSIERTFLMDKLHIPRENQMAIATTLGAVATGALYLMMSGGTLKTVMIGVLTTGIGVAMARGISPKVINEFFLNAASLFLKAISEGITMIMGKTVQEDIFGFLALIAKLSLMFAAGRSYFFDLLKNVATAPTKLGSAVANLTTLGGLSMGLKSATKLYADAISRGAVDFEAASNRYEATLNSLANKQFGGDRIKAEQAIKANMTNASISNPDLREAVLSARERKDASDYKVKPEVVAQRNAMYEADKKLKEERAKYSGAGEKVKAGIGSFASGAGGIVGTGIGLQMGSTKLTQMTEERRLAAIDELLKSDASIGGKQLTKEQATKVASGEIEISNLDEAGKDIAEAIVKNIDVPLWQQIGLQMGGAMAGQALGALLGGAAANAAVFAAEKTWTAVKWAAEKAWFFTKMVAEKAWFAAKMAAEKAFLIAQRVWVVATYVAAATASGAAMAISFLVGLVGLPVLIGAAVVAAVVAAGYLIYKYKDEIWRVMQKIGAVILAAWLDPMNFFKRELPKIFSKIWKEFKDMLPAWLGGSKPSPSIDEIKAASKSTAGAKYATGGYVSGPGTGTSDSILANLSNGEYVVNSRATSKYMPLLEAINNGKRIPGFKNGGAVGGGSGGDIVVRAGGIDNAAADVIGGKIAEAVARRGEAAEAAAKARNGGQRASANRVVAEWDNYIASASRMQTFFNLPAGEMDQGLSPEEKADKDKARKAKDANEKVGMTFGEELDAINSIFPKLTLSMEDYLAMNGEARKQLFDLAAPLYTAKKIIDDLPAGSGQAFVLANKLQSEVKKNEGEASSIADAKRSPFSSLASSIEASGLGITQADFNTFTPEFIGELKAYLAKNEEFAKTIKESPLDQNLIRATSISMMEARKAIDKSIADQSLLLLNDPYAKIEALAALANVSVDKDSFNRLSNLARDGIAGMVNSIIALQKTVNNAATSETDRMAAQLKIDDLRERVGKQLEKPENKAKQAGLDFASRFRDAFSQGVFDFVKTGKLSSIIGIATAFTDNLIQNFIGSLTDSILGSKTKGGSILEGIGAGSVGGGGGFLKSLGGLFGGKKTAAKFGNETATTILSAAPDIGLDVAAPLVEDAKKIGTDIASEASKGLEGLGAGGGGGMAGMAAAAGSLVGLLIGKLFSNGGPVNGPGTSTSDSIPARLSNGEYVVKAKQVRKYGGLIHAINNDQVPAFAEGGLVGASTDASMGLNAATEGSKTNIANNNTNTQTTNLQVVGDVSRQTRSEIIKLIPTIAAGVNSHNKEKGIR